MRPGGSGNLQDLSVWPNPFSDRLRLQVNSTNPVTITVQISGLNGQIEATNNVAVQKGQNIIVLSNLETLSSGMHMLEIITEEGKMSHKIIKQ